MSRPRSGGRATAAPSRGGAAQRGVYVQAPKSDIYVVLLGVALAAMIMGCLLLFLVQNRYGFSRKVTSNGSSKIPRSTLASSIPRILEVSDLTS